ncbi:DUF4190 domain-containing protein [Streptomyces sp. AM 2-1-1]|uniref:DUF4190 domain-containing protein n=1 Tax=unclassified Streptomyces TaxID=2593676 RepID=UPI0023BA009E|nr:DUF4190 domain-containing protein [Streptomyces sp. AM 2-1-1]WEH39544.1 DUF4190 domain-containing protein [Streptomyces sp. AM 2-1-1]
MALSSLVAPVLRPRRPETHPTRRTEAAPVAPDERTAARVRTRDADSLAVASFVLGLVGLLAFNLVLGPTAVVMALLALARSTSRRGRAFLGLALGVADLAVLALVVTAHGVVAWGS